MKDTYERLCKIVDRQLDKIADYLDGKDSKLPEDDARYLDLLTHTAKSLETIKAMDGYGSSERRGRDSMGRYTSREGSYDGRSEWRYYPRSWADGPEGHSEHGDEMREKLRRMADDADDDRIKRALHEAMRNI